MSNAYGIEPADRPVEPAGDREGAPFVTVIVPVLDDALLPQCIDAVASQTYPHDRYEIIVIDNGVEDRPLTIDDRIPNLAVYREPEPGAYRARNLGIQAARGQILAFTDADCCPDPQWLSAGVARLRQNDAPDVVGGEIRLVPREAERPTAAELFELVWGFPQRVFVEEKHFAATANLIACKSIFDSVGSFNPEMMSGGDVEWGRRAHRCGKTLVFSGDALVRHPVRSSIGRLAEKYQRTCGGHYQLRRLAGEGHWGTVVKLVSRPAKSMLSRKDLKPSERVRYAGVELVVCTVQLVELFRLVCGGKPRRR